MEEHIEKGVKIIFSFKTEYFYLCDDGTVIDKYKNIETANKALETFTLCIAHGDMPEEAYSYIRNKFKEEN